MATDTFELKDSGERENYDTGAQRDTASGKGRYDLLSPTAIRRLAVILEKGADKYSARNWEKGIPLRRFIDSALRHIFSLLSGDTEEDHAAQAMWNMMAFLHTADKIKSGELSVSLGKGVPRCLWESPNVSVETNGATIDTAYPYEYEDEVTGTIHNKGKFAPNYRHIDTPRGRLTQVSYDDRKTWAYTTGSKENNKKDLTSSDDEPKIDSPRGKAETDEEFLRRWDYRTRCKNCGGLSISTICHGCKGL